MAEPPRPAPGVPPPPPAADSGAPRWPISVVLSTATGYAAVRATVAHLCRQTIRDRIELVLVGPDAAALAGPEKELRGFLAVRHVAVGPRATVARANAAGVRAARGEVVAFCEDHSFPAPGWAEALVEAHRGEWAVVGPVVVNANPQTLVSWADFVIGYGPWMEPAAAASPRFLPGHNSSYKRAVLLAQGESLEPLLEAETVLHLALAGRGLRLRIEPRARTAHVNFSRLPSWLRVQFLNGRVFAGTRAREWGPGRRLLFAAGSPLIPLLRLARCARELLRPGRPLHLLATASPLLLVGLACDGLGQLLGTLLGVGDAPQRLRGLEFGRIDHVRAEERGIWAAV